MEFLADESAQRILIIAGGILGMFALYFYLAVLSNRSVQRLAERIRRGKNRQVKVQPASRIFSLPWAILVLVGAAIILFAMLIYSRSVLVY